MCNEFRPVISLESSIEADIVKISIVSFLNVILSFLLNGMLSDEKGVMLMVKKFFADFTINVFEKIVEAALLA